MSNAPRPVYSRLGDALVRLPLVEVARDRALVRFPGVGRILVHGTGIEHRHVEPGRRSTDLDFLSDTAAALGELLARRIPLRAAVVSVGGRGVALCGVGPCGKSTTAAALALRGNELIADAVSTVTLTADGVPSVTPRPGGVLLWPDAVEQLGLDPETGEDVRPGLAVRRFGAAANVRHALAPTPLVAAFFLVDDPGGSYRIEPQRGFDAVNRLQGAPWHSFAIAPLGLEAVMFAWATRLASAVQVADIVTPRRHGDPLRVADLVLDALGPAPS